jgi:hypothetical protein
MSANTPRHVRWFRAMYERVAMGEPWAEVLVAYGLQLVHGAPENVGGDMCVAPRERGHDSGQPGTVASQTNGDTAEYGAECGEECGVEWHHEGVTAKCHRPRRQAPNADTAINGESK